MDEGIRVNGVAPGPIWTPLIPSSYSAKEVETFGSGTSRVPMNRAGQPFEVATSFVFLASDDSRYMSGQILHPNGGAIVGSEIGNRYIYLNLLKLIHQVNNKNT